MRFDREMRQAYRRMQKMLSVKNGTRQELDREFKRFRPVLDEITYALEHMDEPLCVAVAGYMKAGKSTLLNAIMRQKVLCTGEMITTYTPTWFKHAPQEMLEIHFTDGSVLSGQPLSELEKWTSIKERERNPRMDDVEYVVIFHPSEVLKKIELIDTPGLFSPEIKDAERTIQFLGLDSLSRAKELNDRHVSQADAVVYAFSGNFKKNDLTAVCSFTSTPINAMGVFTKPDQSFWDPFQPDASPIARIAPVVERLERELKGQLYCIMPVSALMAEGLEDMAEEDWRVLHDISRESSQAIAAALSSAGIFVKKELGGTTDKQRARLLQKLDRYGIYCVANGLQRGVPQADMKEYIYRLSGVEQVSERLAAHFGRRTLLIKSEAALSRIADKLQKIQYADGVSPKELGMCNQLQQEVHRLHGMEIFSEYSLLCKYYEGKLEFPSPEDERRFLELTGENGNDAASRLGLPVDSCIEELLRAAGERRNRWSCLANDPVLPREASNAARIMLNSINNLYSHIEMLSSF